MVAENLLGPPFAAGCTGIHTGWPAPAKSALAIRRMPGPRI
jgi:hypothetical protein